MSRTMAGCCIIPLGLRAAAAYETARAAQERGSPSRLAPSGLATGNAELRLGLLRLVSAAQERGNPG